MDKFFIRFSLQRSLGSFADDQFSFDGVFKMSEAEVSAYVKECELYQTKQAELLKEKINVSSLKGKKALFIGDSLTVDRLGYRRIVTKAAELEALNSAVSGATSVDMARYAYSNVKLIEPDIASILIGTNDAVLTGGEPMLNLVSPDEYRRNIRRILSAAKECAVILMTLPECHEERFNSSNNPNVKQNSNENIAVYSKIIKEEAEALKGIRVIDLKELMRGYSKEVLFEPDGIHLSPFSHTLLADAWLKAAADMMDR